MNPAAVIYTLGSLMIVVWAVILYRAFLCRIKGHKWVYTATGHKCRRCGHSLEIPS